MNASFATEVATAFCLQVSLVVLVTMGLQYWLGTARGNCRLWTACFVAIVGLVAAAMILPHRRWFVFPESVSRQTVLNIVAWQSWMLTVLVSVWLAGVVVAVLRRAVRCLQLIRFLRRRCHPLTQPQIALLPILDSPSQLRIMVCDAIQGPFCWQLHRPVIVLPRYVFAQNPTTLQHVLLHELEHLRTNHPMQHFLQGVCSTLFWFHPLVWMAARRAELMREYLCDEVAAIAGGPFAAYLRTLVTIAEHCGSDNCTNVPDSALAFGNRKSSLVKRSDRLVQLAEQPASHKPERLRSIFAITTLVVGSCLISQIWVPTNAMASSRSSWSPWPTWTAHALHSLDIHVRDFEPFDERTTMHELLVDDAS